MVVVDLAYLFKTIMIVRMYQVQQKNMYQVTTSDGNCYHGNYVHVHVPVL